MTGARIIPFESPEQLDPARELLLEYALAIGPCGCFQNFTLEIDGLPGDYRPPDGRFFLAEIRDQVCGCVALRRNGKSCCEMKRLYVRPAFRGQKLGRQLAETAISAARQIGYQTIRLDTLISMTGAQALYRSLGFRIIPTHDPDSGEDVLYLELKLA